MLDLYPHNVDGRTREAKRLRELMADFVSDLGGPKALSAFDRASLRSMAAAMMAIEKMTADTVDPDQLVRLTSVVHRIGRSLTERHKVAQ